MDSIVSVHSHHAAQGPDVGLAAVALLVQHLGGQVVGGPADRLPPVPRRLQLGGQTEVSRPSAPWTRSRRSYLSGGEGNMGARW